MELKYWFLGFFLIHKLMPNFSIYLILLTALALYIKLDDNSLLSLYSPTCILLHIEFALIVFFSSLLCNIYLVFLVKLTITVKKTKLNRKQIGISFGLTYTKYKVQRVMIKSATLNLQQKIIKKTVESHK